MRDFRELLNRNCSESDSRIVMKGIEVGNYTLSIQASHFHYCTPRTTLINLFDYKTMEVAIFKDGEWNNIRDDSFFDDWKYRTEFLENYDGMVAGYIPINIIQNLCNYIEGKSND